MPPLVLLFPGQGSQKPGMARDLADGFAPARDALETIDVALGAPLSALMYDGPADELTLTHNAQPALLAHGAAVWAAVRDAAAGQVVGAAGHSLGEFTAHHASGTFTAADGARLVRRRGEMMYDAGLARPGAMAALLGDPDRPIEEICEQASVEAGQVVPANYNSPGQLVISGEIAGVERAMELAKAAGVKRAIRLQVSGAFHSPLMAPARAGLEEALAATPMQDPSFPIVANVDARPVTTAAAARARLAEQLGAPVRWTQVVQALATEHPGALFVEMGPGNVLVGLLKKIAPEVQSMTCGTAAEVETLRARLSSPATS